MNRNFLEMAILKAKDYRNNFHWWYRRSKKHDPLHMTDKLPFTLYKTKNMVSPYWKINSV